MRSSSVAAVLVFAGVLCMTAGAGEAPPDAPTLRYGNYLAVQAARGSEVRCEIAHRPPGSRVWRDWLSTRLIRPDGFVAASARARPGETAELAAQVDWDGLSAIEINPGSSLVYARFEGETPHAYRSTIGGPLITVGAWGPLYFYVPKGTPYFNVWLQASVTREGLHYTVANPLGDVAFPEKGDTLLEAEMIVVHVVNTNVPLGVNAPGPIPVDNIELDVPLPPGAHAKSATAHAPGEPDVQLPLESTDGRARLRLPRLGIYRVVESELL